jgi:hypothetical protein
MDQFLEMYSDDDGDDDDDDVDKGNYASAYSSPIATHDYDNNDDTSSSSDHSTVGNSGGVGSRNEYEVNDDDAEDANHDDNDDDANDAHIPFPIFHLVISHPLLIKVPFVMAPMVKRITTMMMTMITHLPMPLLLLVQQGVITTMLLSVTPMPSMFLIITMLLVAVMMISYHHLLTSPCNQMFLHQTLPHLLAPIAIQNAKCTLNSRGTMLMGRIHQMCGPVLMIVYQM